MLKILHFIFGRLYFQVKGYQTERFLNLCAKNHLVLWELKPVSDGYVFFIRRSSYQMLEALAEKANVDLPTSARSNASSSASPERGPQSRTIPSSPSRRTAPAYSAAAGPPIFGSKIKVLTRYLFWE